MRHLSHELMGLRFNMQLAGVMEYWSATTHEFPSDAVQFRSTLDTDLYACAKVKATTRGIAFSRDGSQVAMLCSDR